MGTVSNRGAKDRPLWYCRHVDAFYGQPHADFAQTQPLGP